jgi:hypothetical protein
MPEFIYVQCPNCKIKIKIDKDKKYHDCPDCKYEFGVEQVSASPPAAKVAQEKKESIFGKFLRENKL